MQGVSVVLACYNGAAFVADALESVFRQTCTPAEIIVVDDASTDDTRSVLATLSARSPFPLRVVRLRENSGGPSLPLNVGVEAAASDIIVTLDQDDIMAPDRVETQAQLLADEPACPLVFGAYSQGGIEEPRSEQPRFSARQVLDVPHKQCAASGYLLDAKSAYERLLNGENFIHGASNIAFRKSAWSRLGGFNTSYRAIWDYDFELRCCTLGDIGFVPRLTHHRRNHDNNLSSRRVPWLKEMAALRSQHVATPFFEADLSELRGELPRTWFALGYYEAIEGRPLASWRAYARGMTAGGRRASAVWGMLKAIPHCLRAPWFSAGGAR